MFLTSFQIDACLRFSKHTHIYIHTFQKCFISSCIKFLKEINTFYPKKGSLHLTTPFVIHMHDNGFIIFYILFNIHIHIFIWMFIYSYPLRFSNLWTHTLYIHSSNLYFCYRKLYIYNSVFNNPRICHKIFYVLVFHFSLSNFISFSNDFLFYSIYFICLIFPFFCCLK